MNRDLSNCGVCYRRYNLSTRRPMCLPQCGHTLCEVCVNVILEDANEENEPKCPFDRKKFPLDPDADGDYLRPQINMFALNSLEEIPQYQECEQHLKQEEFFCRTDGIKICSDCFFLGPHKSHKIERLDIVKNLIEEKSRSLESCVKDWDTHVGKIQEVLEKRKLESLGIVESIFGEHEIMLKKQKRDLKFRVVAGYEQEKARIASEFNKRSTFRNDLTEKINEYNDPNHPDLSQLMDEDIQEIISKYDTSVYEKNLLNFEQNSEKIKVFFGETLKNYMKKIAPHKLPNLEIIIKQEDTEGVENFDSDTLPNLNLGLTSWSSFRIPSYLMIKNPNGVLDITISTTLNEEFFIAPDSWGALNTVKVTLCSASLNPNDITILKYLFEKFDEMHRIVICCPSLNTNNLSQDELKSKLEKIFNILFSNAKNLHSVHVQWDLQNSSKILMKFMSEKVFRKAINLTSLKIHLPDTTNLSWPLFQEFINSLSPIQKRLEIFEFIATLNLNNKIPLTKGLVMPKLRQFVFEITCKRHNNIIQGEYFEKFFKESLQSTKLLEKLSFYLKAKSERNLLSIFEIIKNMAKMEKLEAIVSCTVSGQNQEYNVQKIGKLISNPLSSMVNLRSLSLRTDLFDDKKFLKQDEIKEFIENCRNIS